MPPEGDLPGDTWIRYWLYQAFDAYVLHDGDLAAALSDAQAKAVGFQTCAAALPPFTFDLASVAAITACAKKIDASLG